MITPQDITIVICHGSYHTPIAYTPFINALKSQGYEVHCPQRPTCDLSRLNVGDTANPDFTNDPPPGGYPTDTDDVATTQALLDQLIKKENKQVLLAARSSGGYIATQAATPAYQAQARKRAGESGGIIGIFYFGAFLIPVGESVHTFFNKDVKPDDPLPPFFKFYKNGLGTFAHAAEYLFHDLPAREAEKWERTLTAAPNMFSPLTNDAYSALPCAYVVLDNDRILPRGYQEGMVRLQEEKGNRVVVFHAPAGHSVQLSWVDGLVGVLGEFVGGL